MFYLIIVILFVIFLTYLIVKGLSSYKPADKPTLFSFGGLSLIVEGILFVFIFSKPDITITTIVIPIGFFISIIPALVSMIKNEKGIFAPIGFTFALILLLLTLFIINPQPNTSF